MATVVSPPESLAGVSPDLVGAPEDFDRILHTAGDRPDTVTLPALADPAADHTDALRARRRADVETKHQRIRDLLDATDHDAVVLGPGLTVADGLPDLSTNSPRLTASSHNAPTAASSLALAN